MFTIEYKIFYIHGYTDKNECKVQFKAGNAFLGTFKSLLAAKQACTKFLNKC